MHYLMIFLLMVAGAALVRRIRQRNEKLLKHLRKNTPYVEVKPPANLPDTDEKNSYKKSKLNLLPGTYQ